jgi:hypothetical protein
VQDGIILQVNSAPMIARVAVGEVSTQDQVEANAMEVETGTIATKKIIVVP